MNIYKSLALKYFEFFSNKDIKNLKLMFSEDVDLRDWEINATGIESVLDANLKIFNSVKTIMAKPISLIVEDSNLSAELEIIVNDVEILRVVDIIQFNNEKKIKSIRAFKG